MVERRQKSYRRTIEEILDLLQEDADNRYHGNLADNLLACYNRLQTDDRRTFLRSSLALQLKHQLDLEVAGQKDVQVEDAVRIDKVSVKHEREAIACSNSLERQRMKNWLLQVFFIISILITIALVFAGFFADAPSEFIMSSISRAAEILNLILGTK